MNDNRSQIFEFQFAGPVVDFHIAETMEREARLPGFDPLAAQSVLVGGFGETERARPKLAMLQHFGMAQSDGVSGRSLYLDP